MNSNLSATSHAASCSWFKSFKAFSLGSNVYELLSFFTFSTVSFSFCSAIVIRSSDCMFLPCHVRVSEWIHNLWLPEYQQTPCFKQAPNLKLKWLQLDLNPHHLVRKRILNHLAQLGSFAKWSSVRLQTKWLWVQVQGTLIPTWKFPYMLVFIYR